MPGGNPQSQVERLKLNPHTTFVIEVKGVIDVHYASLTSQGVQHRVIYLDGHTSRYQPRPTGFNFGEQTGNSVFPLVIAVPQRSITWLTYYTQLKNPSFQQSTSKTDTVFTRV